jgi:hypothetical protein
VCVRYEWSRGVLRCGVCSLRVEKRCAEVWCVFVTSGVEVC